MKRFSLPLSLFVLACLASPARPDAPMVTDKLNKKIDNFTLVDSAGKSFSLHDLKGPKAVVLTFLSFDCPVSNSYAQPLADLHRNFTKKGVAFVGIAFAGKDELARHVKEFGLPFPVLSDKDLVVADLCKASTTPEVFVLDHNFVLRYRGRIDNGYVARLKKAPVTTRHDLREALDELLAGKSVSKPVTPAVGCPITREKETKKTGKVTYYRDVLPILQKNCQQCHRPGEVGPFSLMTYKQAVNWSADIKEYTQAGKMPPWKPVDGFAFHNSRKMSQKEIDTLAAWVDEGTPAGDAKDAPPPAKFTGGWQLGTPDLVLETGEMTVGPGGRDLFRCFVLPTNLTEDKIVTSIEVRPSNPRVVHHTLNFIDRTGRGRELEKKEKERPKTGNEQDVGPGYSRSMGVGFQPQGGLSGWAPGQRARHLPEGTGYFLPKGSDVVVQVHYHRTGRVEKDNTKIGLYFAKKPIQKQFQGMVIPGRFLFIPKGNERYKVEGAIEVQQDCVLHSVLRRMRHPGLASVGLSVLMRYTLRLLTLDQLSRAATLICALERERQQHADKLGDWPFEIGLWVGRGATPNEMGRKSDGNPNSARSRTIAYKNNSQKAAPIPLEECPWCGTKFTPNSFQLVPNPDQPSDLRITCVNRACDFTRNNPLPILAVDEPIYRRLPCFLIATVDKFAAMPWTGPVGGFFGRADRHDKNGFYGPCEPNVGLPLPAPLQPPDLVIQDELHLISGPMGTMVGLYESALDELCARRAGGASFQLAPAGQVGNLPPHQKLIRPKIVASTATVRRAEKQIRALFCRRTVDIFPPPGPDRRDSFFAHTHTPQESHARLYLGVAAQGRSLKVILLRVYLALLGAAQKWYAASGGKKNKDNPADPYMTLLGYFNSLRELGGSRRIIEDEVSTQITNRSNRKREGETDSPFADRTIGYEPVELTSRVSTDKVADAKRKLALPFHDDDRVDVAIATNMISVGLDITRLGLMVVLGQPKTSAEYIQATSRVGRDQDRPGLVVTILNVHRPRDRSHYERFAFYHESFYRSVEATSVTPFSPRALDRGLAGTLVALARQGHAPMTPPKGATEILRERGKLDFVIEALAARAAAYAETPEESAALRQRVRERAVDLLDEWSHIAHDLQAQGVQLQYQIETGAAQRLLYEFLNPELKKLPMRHRKFRANRSMRDVEPSVNLWVKTLDNIDVEEDD